MKRNALICAVMVLTAGVLHAQNPNLGTSGAQFLKIPVGPRPELVGRLRAALQEACDDPAEVDRRSPEALRRVHELFTWDKKAAMTLAVWEWVLGRGPKPGFPMPLPDPAPTSAPASTSAAT